MPGVIGTTRSAEGGCGGDRKWLTSRSRSARLEMNAGSADREVVIDPQSRRGVEDGLPEGLPSRHLIMTGLGLELSPCLGPAMRRTTWEGYPPPCIGLCQDLAPILAILTRGRGGQETRDRVDLVAVSAIPRRTTEQPVCPVEERRRPKAVLFVAPKAAHAQLPICRRRDRAGRALIGALKSRAILAI